MLKKVGTLVIAVVAGAVLAGGVASARSSTAQSAKTHATEIDTLETHKVQHTIDVGTPGFSVGDVITVVSRLTSHDGSTRIGVLHEVCTAVRTKVFSLECVGTTEFADGQISTTGEFPPSDPDTSFAVTGGTGEYEAAGGHVRITSAPDHSLYLDYFVTS